MVLASVVLAAPAAAVTAPFVHGVDVSSYQHQRHGAINWARVRGSSIRFAAIKVTEGNYYVNPFYFSDTHAALRAGLYVAPYVFANPHASGGARQAAFAIERARYRWAGRMLPLEVDLEPDPYARREHVNVCYGLSRRRMVGWIQAFASRTRRLTGARPLIYTTATWWRRCTGDSKALRVDPLWVAAYGTHRPQMPAAWPRWTFWQYRSTGRVRGIRGSLDLDYGTRGLFALLRPHHHHRHRVHARARPK